jgi:hypothetical protein
MSWRLGSLRGRGKLRPYIGSDPVLMDRLGVHLLCVMRCEECCS